MYLQYFYSHRRAGGGGGLICETKLPMQELELKVQGDYIILLSFIPYDTMSYGLISLTKIIL
jgi:hypothetical protein